MKIHPVAALFPMLPDDELDALAADIKAHGQHSPVVYQGDTLLDGRNRLEACRRAGVEPQQVEFHGEDATAFILGANLNRRHLTREQRDAVIRGLREQGMSIPTIAKAVGVSVGTAHNAAQAVKIEKVTGQDGKTYPAAKPPQANDLPPAPPPPPPPEMPSVPTPAPVRPQDKKAPFGRDILGRPITEAARDMFDRAHEAKLIQQTVDKAIAMIEQAKESGDRLFAAVNKQTALAGLERCKDALRVAVPYVVCTSCQGNPEAVHCRLCHGRGALSRWEYETLVPEETRNRLEEGRK
jgi:hypothetical protein